MAVDSQMGQGRQILRRETRQSASPGQIPEITGRIAMGGGERVYQHSRKSAQCAANNQRSSPGLCRGGSRSLTFRAVGGARLGGRPGDSQWLLTQSNK